MADTVLEHSGTVATVARAIARLPTNYRAGLVMRDIDGLGIGEVADALHLTEGIAKVCLHRARSALRKLIEPAISC